MSGLLERRSNDARKSMTTGLAQKTVEWVYRGRDSLARFEDAAERTTTRYQLLPVAVVSALYLAITIQLAKTKLIWTDEFFTLYLSRLSMKDLWAALLTGGDQRPPFFYLIHQWVSAALRRALLDIAVADDAGLSFDDAVYPWFGLNVKAYKPDVETHRQFAVWSGGRPEMDVVTLSVDQ